jgi:hypothetical protein
VGRAARTRNRSHVSARAHHGAPEAHHLDCPTLPAVLPQAVVTFDDTGRARLAINNTDRDAIDYPDRPIRGRELGTVLAAIADQVGGPIRVEIREPDGSRYADILEPDTGQRARRPERDGEERSPHHAALCGEGFLPNEQVLVAVVATTLAADAGGTIRLTGPPDPARRVEELILFGEGSGTVVRGAVPGRSTRSGRRWRR